ncbi:hypothetical protein ACFYSF_22825 [Streptomyces canus]|uniref:hypothetical protein n=1 Tax=Streptomyces canus TaxID=58343 RepID=UPI0036B6EA47
MTARRFFGSLTAGIAVAALTTVTPWPDWWWLTGAVVFVVGLTGRVPDIDIT